ncbi:hypothetical protein Dcar01_00994 [Deinococcus carri]|uniref:Uncharacterized protein n=1 Tax=Deinococcus carri TaxID=1211323 RepID=A0ABP9W4I8_9DEIO
MTNSAPTTVPTPQAPRPAQHLWLLVRNLPGTPGVEVTEVIAQGGAGRSFQYQLPSNPDRQALLGGVLLQAVKRCTNNGVIALHSPHAEYVRIADRQGKRPPELASALKRHNLTLTLARRINGVGLFADYAEALHEHRIPELPPMIDFQLHTGCITDGQEAYVGAVLAGHGRLHTWRNTSKGHDLTLSELHAVRWAFTTLPAGSTVEIHNQTPDARRLWTEPEAVLEEHAAGLKPYMIKLAQIISSKQLRFQAPKSAAHPGLFRQHARLMAGMQFADAARERHA